MEENLRYKIKYVIPDHYKDYYANGVWVGRASLNELFIHFHYDRPPLPKSETYEGKDDKWVLTEKEVGGDLARIMQTAVVMDIKTATLLRDWLSELINNPQKNNK